tara:strand:- start:224 stop:727 length:504 start_codon:yes stop_codon:yes gene_type:complete
MTPDQEAQSSMFGMLFAQILFEFAFEGTSQEQEFNTFFEYYICEGNEGLTEIEDHRDHFEDTHQGIGECVISHGSPVSFLLRAHDLFEKVQGEEYTSNWYITPEDMCSMIMTIYLPVCEDFQTNLEVEEEEEEETPYFPDPPAEYYDIPPPYAEDFPPLYELPIYSH